MTFETAAIVRETCAVARAATDKALTIAHNYGTMGLAPELFEALKHLERAVTIAGRACADAAAMEIGQTIESAKRLGQKL